MQSELVYSYQEDRFAQIEQFCSIQVMNAFITIKQLIVEVSHELPKLFSKQETYDLMIKMVQKIQLSIVQSRENIYLSILLRFEKLGSSKAKSELREYLLGKREFQEDTFMEDWDRVLEFKKKVEALRSRNRTELEILEELQAVSFSGDLDEEKSSGDEKSNARFGCSITFKNSNHNSSSRERRKIILNHLDSSEEESELINQNRKQRNTEIVPNHQAFLSQKIEVGRKLNQEVAENLEFPSFISPADRNLEDTLQMVREITNSANQTRIPTQVSNILDFEESYSDPLFPRKPIIEGNETEKTTQLFLPSNCMDIPNFDETPHIITPPQVENLVQSEVIVSNPQSSRGVLLAESHKLSLFVLAFHFEQKNILRLESVPEFSEIHLVDYCTFDGGDLYAIEYLAEPVIILDRDNQLWKLEHSFLPSERLSITPVSCSSALTTPQSPRHFSDNPTQKSPTRQSTKRLRSPTLLGPLDSPRRYSRSLSRSNDNQELSLLGTARKIAPRFLDEADDELDCRGLLKTSPERFFRDCSHANLEHTKIDGKKLERPKSSLVKRTSIFTQEDTEDESKQQEQQVEGQLDGSSGDKHSEEFQEENQADKGHGQQVGIEDTPCKPNSENIGCIRIHNYKSVFFQQEGGIYFLTGQGICLKLEVDERGATFQKVRQLGSSMNLDDEQADCWSANFGQTCTDVIEVDSSPEPPTNPKARITAKKSKKQFSATTKQLVELVDEIPKKKRKPATASKRHLKVTRKTYFPADNVSFSLITSCTQRKMNCFTQDGRHFVAASKSESVGMCNLKEAERIFESPFKLLSVSEDGAVALGIRTEGELAAKEWLVYWIELKISVKFESGILFAMDFEQSIEPVDSPAKPIVVDSGSFTIRNPSNEKAKFSPVADRHQTEDPFQGDFAGGITPNPRRVLHINRPALQSFVLNQVDPKQGVCARFLLSSGTQFQSQLVEVRVLRRPTPQTPDFSPVAPDAALSDGSVGDPDLIITKYV